MAKKVYKFNAEHLEFYQVNHGFKKRVLQFMAYFGVTIIVGIIINVFFAYYFDNPKERTLRNDNRFLKKEYKNLEEKYRQANEVLADLKQRDNSIFKVIFDAKPYQNNIAQASYISDFNFSGMSDYECFSLVNKDVERIEMLQVQSLSQTIHVQNLYTELSSMVDSLTYLPFMMPIENNDLQKTAAGFGWKIHPIYKIKKMHTGIDFTTPLGTPVFATANGIVKTIYRNRFAKDGLAIEIDHGKGYTTYYAHLNDFKVREGQNVTRGQTIAIVGNTGVSTAPHLHYEIRKDMQPINPVHFFVYDLSPEKYKTINEIAANNGQSFD